LPIFAFGSMPLKLTQPASRAAADSDSAAANVAGCGRRGCACSGVADA
jgi:hypothetical protein